MPLTRPWLLALWALAVLGSTRPAPAAADGGEGFDPLSLQAVAHDVAAELMSGIKTAAGTAPLKLAVRPFRPDDIVPEDATSQLNAAVEAALKDAGGSSVIIVDRADLPAAWADADEFQNAKLEDNIQAGVADILVLGDLRPIAGGGFSLFYKADDLRPGHIGTVLGVMREPHVLPAAFATSQGRPLEEAVRTAAIKMANRMVEGSEVAGGHPRAHATGETTEFGTYVMSRFVDDLNEALPNIIRRHRGQQAVTGAAPAKPELASHVTFGMTAFDADTWVDVAFSDESPDGGGSLSVFARIAKDSIPTTMLPIKPRCGTGTHHVSGEALVGKQLDHDGALRAARALARARAVAEETCNKALDGAPTVVRDSVDATSAMQAIAGGITYDEHWTDQELDGGKRVRTALTARVRALAGGSAPKLTVTLSPVVVTDAAFEIALQSDAMAYVAIFAWQSDDRVVRLYPIGKQHALTLYPGVRMELPQTGEPAMMTEPRPHLTTDFEALLVVASAGPLDYDAMAQEPAATLAETMARSRPIADLFAALAKLPGPVSLAVVPYQIVPQP